MKFKYKRKGWITQDFAKNANPSYKKSGLVGHTGVDWKKGYGTPVQIDNAGHIYKIIYSDKSPSNWQAVYQLVKIHKDMYMEICEGHLSEVWVKEGQNLPEDAFIGAEGNKGLVYGGGVKITPTMQRKGDRRGSHVHTSYRPVVRVKKKTKGEYYLLDSYGQPFYKNGYYEILERDNERVVVLIPVLLIGRIQYLLS